MGIFSVKNSKKKKQRGDNINQACGWLEQCKLQLMESFPNNYQIIYRYTEITLLQHPSPHRGSLRKFPGLNS